MFSVVEGETGCSQAHCGTAHTQKIQGDAGSADLGALLALLRTLDLIHMGNWEQIKDFDWRSIMGSSEKNEVRKITRTCLRSQRTPVDFPGGPVVKNLPDNTGDTGSILGLERFHVPRATKPASHNY